MVFLIHPASGEYVRQDGQVGSARLNGEVLE
jgi:hypothetical protein